MTDEHDDCFGAYQHLNKEYKESRTFTMGKVSCWGLKNTSFKNKNKIKTCPNLPIFTMST